ncbi:MAG: GTPase HflX [Firmicutes bacterium]|nr:GTPase HflX [Bacillota bacterium]
MERALLVLVHRRGDAWTAEEEAAELVALARSAGAEVAGVVVQSRPEADPATLIGRGKVEEVRAELSRTGAGLVVVAPELTPAQQRNLERALEAVVIDRTQLVLDIFAQRARTREGALQVELAQLRYLLPRLAGMGRALSRLGGGIGTRGPGETKLEADRRRLRERIRALEREIEAVRRHRDVLRAGRARLDLPVVALVGYTNAGKSTLFNALTGAGVRAEDALFATLDPTARRAQLGGRTVILTDTVGFIHDLPHTLVAAFRATLEEAALADILLHVLDISRDGWEERMAAVDEVLDEIGAGAVPRLTVLNQIDRLPGGAAEARRRLPAGVPLSARTGEGLDALGERVAELVARCERLAAWLIPYERLRVLDWLRRAGRVERVEYTDAGVRVVAWCDEATARRVKSALEAPAARG